MRQAIQSRSNGERNARQRAKFFSLHRAKHGLGSIAAACAVLVSITNAQPPAAPATAPNLPTPIYWKQNLFLIPYQWSSATQPASAQQVVLYVSKDRGANWQKISEAKPQVKAFNYRAEGDGEYWFDVRTIDSQGRSTPFGPFRPELRVIVDTSIPRIEQLRAWTAENGGIEIECHAADPNLDPASLRVETQTSPTSVWQPIALQPLPAPPSPTPTILGRWQPPAGVHPLAIRATIYDRAGNSAVYQTPITATPPMTGPSLSQPGLGTSTTNATPSAPALPNSAALPPQQSWPAGAVSGAPLQLWTSGKSSADDGVTAYGNPTVTKQTPILGNASSATIADATTNPARVPAQFADAVKRSNEGWTSESSTASGPAFTPLEPFRQPASANVTPVGAAAPPTHNPSSPPKLVGSRTFSLEYDLDDVGHAGVSRVELWGTRDGGQTWNRYTVDDDNRSPLVVTVDNEGLYGFKILVQSASGPPISAPRSGEEPELWVSVDLHRPTVELTSIERGEGNFSDHLVLHWRAQDNNLDGRPIAIFFSSRSTGPWSAIATNLENTGNYAWRVERYVPSRIYLRIEARDTAGNLAAFQTREPLEVDAVRANAKLRTPASTGPTATNAANAIRQ